ncbi:MAG: hypothetical protein GXY36_08080 [Chloroflexi bacterium]|nr:hypothetical protein [Chloroflexota bacterium]
MRYFLRFPVFLLALSLVLAGWYGRPGPSLAQDTYDLDAITDGVGRYDFLTPNDAEPRVFLVQENHVYVSGQVESAVMIHRLVRDYGLSLIGSEGAFPVTSFDTSWFNAGLSPNQVRNIAVELLGEGEISQAELAAIVYPDYADVTVGGDFAIFGIDDQSYYESADVTARWAGEFDLAMLYTAIALLDTVGQEAVLDHFDVIPDEEGPEMDAWREQLYTLTYTNHPDLAIRNWYADSILEPGACMMRGVTEDLNSLDAGLEIIKAHQTDTEAAWGLSLAESINFAGQEREFYINAHEREVTMVYELGGWLADHPDRAILAVIGAGHTGWMERTLEDDGYSTVVLSSESLCDPSVAIELSDEAYVSKMEGQSVDIFGGLAGLLSGVDPVLSIKPGNVLEQPWFQVDAQVRGAALLATEALRANPNATLSDIFGGVPLLPGVTVDLNSWEPVGPPGRGVFAINLNIADIPVNTIYVGILPDIDQSEPNDLDLETLLLRELDQLRDRGEPQHPEPNSDLPPTEAAPLLQVAPDIKGAVGTNRDAVINTVEAA